LTSCCFCWGSLRREDRNNNEQSWNEITQEIQWRE
jgi:hypothetical protein